MGLAGELEHMLTKSELENRVRDSYELPNKVCDVISLPLVTVFTSTYNHAAFIEQCINGVLAQKTSFPIEFIIGEDYSTDGTREIVFESARRYPEIIRVITADYNVGVKANVQRCRRAARGKFMALCEGDDYWTDPRKLQKQIEAMEAHPECSVCGHKVRRVDEHGNWDGVSIVPGFKVPALTDLEYFLKYGYYLQTCSMVIRRGMDTPHPESALHLQAGDCVTQLLLIQKGPALFLPDIMADYRIHGGGIHAGKDMPDKVKHALAYNEWAEGYVPEQYLWLIKRERAFLKGLQSLLQSGHLNIRCNLERLVRAMCYCDQKLMMQLGWQAWNRNRMTWAVLYGLCSFLRNPLRSNSLILVGCALLKRPKS
jgi:glycosyltransferase involved in cell wall biosynthesis